jgi:hypothetical protein
MKMYLQGHVKKGELKYGRDEKSNFCGSGEE